MFHVVLQQLLYLCTPKDGETITETGWFSEQNILIA